jgi:phenylpropionate dioxygenase-like ring-hydroxylating dioxygenase large terminal subunit
MAQSADKTEQLIEQTGEKIGKGKFPFQIYSDDAIYEEELRRLFSRTWNYIGHTSEFQEPGDYARRYIAGDPYILTYDRDGEYHALLDACKHRGAQFCTADKGNTTHFRCPYHGWTYRNDGELQGMPYKEESYQDLDPGEIRLEKATVERYNGLIFGRLVDEGPSLEEYLGDFTWYLDLLVDLTEEGMTVVADPHRSVAPHNWKTPAQNFGGDNYHVLATHQAVFESEGLGEAGPWETLPSAQERKGDYNHLAVTENASLSFLVNYDTDTHMGYPDEVTDYYSSDLTDKQRELFSQSVYFFSTLYPNTNINHAISGGGWGGPWVQIRTFVPRGPSETEIMSWWLVPKELADDEEFMERAYHGFETTSPGGTFEADDLSVWAGIADSTDSVTLELNETVGNMEQGLEGMSDDLETVDDPLFGPAEVQRFGGYYSEAGARNHLKHWHRYMSMGRPELDGSETDE